MKASNWKIVSLRILAFALTCWLAAVDRGNSSVDLKLIKSITFAGRTIERAHSIRWQDWTIDFGEGRPFAEYSEQGTTLRGLRCGNAKVAAIRCHLFMAMKPIESFAHFCELSPDDGHAPGTWPIRIDCPNEIEFYR